MRERSNLTRPNWTKLHFIYFALAVFDLVAVGLGLWLGRQLHLEFRRSEAAVELADSMYDQTFQIMRESARLAILLEEASDHRGDATFVERLKRQQVALAASLQAVEATELPELPDPGSAAFVKGSASTAIAANPPKTIFALPWQSRLAQESPHLLEEYQIVEARVLATAEAAIAASEILANKLPAADVNSVELAASSASRAVALLNSALLPFAKVADVHSDITLARSRSVYDWALNVEYGIAAMIFMMLVFVTAYGHTVGRVLREKFDALEQSYDQVEDMTKTLRLMNEEVVATNLRLKSHIEQMRDAQSEMLRRVGT